MAYEFRDDATRRVMIARTLPIIDMRNLISKYSNECDYCDLRYGITVTSSLKMENGQVTYSTTQRKHGFFAKARIQDEWGDRFVPAIDPKNGSEALRLAVKAARGFRQESNDKISEVDLCPGVPEDGHLLTSLKSSIESLLNRNYQYQVEISQQHIEEDAVTTDGHQSSYQESYGIIMIMFKTHFSRKTTTAVNGQITKRGQAPWQPGDITRLGETLITRIEEGKSRGEAPVGSFPLVLDPNLGSILAHEIFGHGLEADFVLENKSFFANKLNKQVTGQGVTVLDCGNFLWGFVGYDCDQEGSSATPTMLIDNGYLRNFIHSRETAFKFGCQPTGNGRAGSIASITIPRISNLQVLPGATSLAEMVRNINFGVYANRALGEAFFFPERGLYWVEAESGYLIEKGVITRPLSSFAITGTIGELLEHLLVLREEASQTLPGFCLKRQQYVPVDIRCPPIYIGRARISPIL